MRVPAPSRFKMKAPGKHRSPGRAGHAIVPGRPSGCAARSTQWRYRATLAVELSGAAVHGAKEAAGVPSAWSQLFNHPSRDHADGATLGRRRRTRRPGLQDAGQRGEPPAYRCFPLSLGYAIPTAARLMGRRDARPHNTIQKAGIPGRRVARNTSTPTRASHCLSDTRSQPLPL